MSKITIPASKSQTIRALLIATAAGDRSVIRNPLFSEDTKSCMAACEAFGAKITVKDGGAAIEVDATGVKNGPVDITCDCRNSGTTLYLATGLAAALGKRVRFTGDEQLTARPVSPLLKSLADLGATVSERKIPFTVSGPLSGGITSIECPTSQYLSSLLLACPLAKGDSIIDVPLLFERPYVDITLAWLAKQGIEVTNSAYKRFHIPGNQEYFAFDEHIGGDFSSASFFFVLAAITGRQITVAGLDRYDPQGDKGILSILSAMGAKVEWISNDSVSVTGGPLHGGEFDLNDMPDTLPILSVAACFAEGETRLVNVAQARIKETDRIAVMQESLSKLGADIRALEDGLVINGGSPLHGGTVSGYKDHRVIMALEIARQAIKGDVIIDSVKEVNVTFPTFHTLLEEALK